MSNASPKPGASAPGDRPIEIIEEPAAMRDRAEQLRRSGQRICVVPTMGYLHDGHLSLLRAGRAQADILIVTLFVNPTQFAPGEDLATYPRDRDGDLAKARSCGVDIAFCPRPEAMYPAGFQTHVTPGDLAAPLCGASRAGHFRGVATVVLKLFNLTRPDLAVFGQKDYQQLAVIRRMVRDLDLAVTIVAGPIVREPDGLAMSSRNAYLAPAERAQALCLVSGLRAAQDRFRAGERSAQALVAAAGQPIAAADLARIDYLELRDADDLSDITEVTRPAVLAMAVFVGATRLIDNLILDPAAPDAGLGRG
ncbi:MAG: pantoate--beta-alanine ligase [Myxococcota bacterium]